jgi:hypothetical protein
MIPRFAPPKALQNSAFARHTRILGPMDGAVLLASLIIAAGVVASALFFNYALIGAANWINQETPRQRTFNFH